MNTPLTTKIHGFLNRNGPASPKVVAEAIPELSDCGGEQRALLLMRLDSDLEPLKGGLWAIRGVLENEDQKIRHAAEEYFKSIERPGAPLSSTVINIYQQTHIEPPKIKETLGKFYLISGSNIFNRPRRKEED